MIVDEIPLLVNGKIDRQQLLRDYAKIYKSNTISIIIYRQFLYRILDIINQISRTSASGMKTN